MSKHRPFLYVARNEKKPKAPIYLPEGYKRRTNTVVQGRSESGEVSPLGTVAETEDWDGRVAAAAATSTIHYTRDEDGRWRPMTLQEMIDRGHFIVGRGPTGVRKQEEGIKNEQSAS